MVDWKNYISLKEGEVLKEGDECLVDRMWVKSRCVGGVVPSPLYTSHRLYRRKINPRYIYATSENTPAVKVGYELGGYVKERIFKCP